MPKKEENQVAIRANVSPEANENVALVRAQQRVKGNTMTREQTIDYILKRYREIP